MNSLLLKITKRVRIVAKSSDTWEAGFLDALVLMQIEVDKFLVLKYNDSRTCDNLLDLRLSIDDLKGLILNETVGMDQVPS